MSGQGESLIAGLPNNQPIDKAKIADFWERMTGLFGYRWASQYGKLPTKEWAMLINHLSMEAIESGVRNMVASNTTGWPPTPIEFNALCTNVSLQALGLPDLNTAFNRALSGMYRNAVIEAAAKETGVFDLQRGTTNDLSLKKRFEYNYLEMARRWAKGESLKSPVTKAIENTKQTASFGVCDDLIGQEVQRQQASGKNGYEAFKALKKKGVKA